MGCNVRGDGHKDLGTFAVTSWHVSSYCPRKIFARSELGWRMAKNLDPSCQLRSWEVLKLRKYVRTWDATTRMVLRPAPAALAAPKRNPRISDGASSTWPRPAAQRIKALFHTGNRMAVFLFRIKNSSIAAWNSRQTKWDYIQKACGTMSQDQWSSSTLHLGNLDAVQPSGSGPSLQPQLERAKEESLPTELTECVGSWWLLEDM